MKVRQMQTFRTIFRSGPGGKCPPGIAHSGNGIRGQNLLSKIQSFGPLRSTSSCSYYIGLERDSFALDRKYRTGLAFLMIPMNGSYDR